MSGSGGTDRMHPSARLEDRVHAGVERWMRRRGWRPRVVAFTGYGRCDPDGGWVRVLARVLLAPPDTGVAELRLGRGWRRFLSATAAGVPVTVRLGEQEHEVVSGRGGYVDTVLPVRPGEVAAGWQEAQLSADGSTPVPVGLRVVDGGAAVAVVSDIDDTVIVTALPRPLVAAWNTFVRHERSRRPVRGMASLYQDLAAQHPDALFVYLSTGPWNVAPVLEEFLSRHAYPPGPLLMTDWGPTPDGWFRSGQQHKRRELARLLEELPGVRWLLIGDDGQHDPEIYAAAAQAHPDRVRAVLIRQLSAVEQVRTHGSPEPIRERDGHSRPPAVPELHGPDGFALESRLRDLGLLDLG